MKYVLTEEEYANLVAQKITTEEKNNTEDALKLVLSKAEYISVDSDPMRFGQEILKVAINMDKVPDIYKPIIASRVTRK